jgi:membrane-bound acyltransferase YfiQ involved in biofilm formation
MSYVLYALLAGLILWGMKFAGKNRFHDDFMSLETTKCLQGICAVCVVLHHVSQTGGFRRANELTLFPDAGFLFVGIFFFCSGYGLVTSMKNKSGYLNTFPRKRLAAVLVPFYTMTAGYAVFYAVIGRQMTAAQWILSALGLVLMNPHAWYIVVITLLYLAFYLAFTRIKPEKAAFTAIGLFILAQMIFGLLWGHLAWWAGKPFWWQDGAGFASAKWWMMPAALWFQGEWWINSTALFLVGMLFARFERPVVDWLKRGYWLKLAAAIVVLAGCGILSNRAIARFSYWTEFGPSHSLGVGNKAMCLASQIPFVAAFVAVVFMVMMKARSVNPATKFLGKISLEIYLMHNICLMLFGPLIPGASKGFGPETAGGAGLKTNLAIFAVLVIAGGVVLGIAFNYLNRKLIRFTTR